MRQFQLRPILACVAVTKGAGAFGPVLEELLDLLEFMTGERFGPSIVPDFQIQVAMCGLALVRQHPELGRIQAWPKCYGDGYEAWLADQVQRFGQPLKVRSIKDDNLSAYRKQTEAIARQILAKAGWK